MRKIVRFNRTDISESIITSYQSWFDLDEILNVLLYIGFAMMIIGTIGKCVRMFI